MPFVAVKFGDGESLPAFLKTKEHDDQPPRRFNGVVWRIALHSAIKRAAAAYGATLGEGGQVAAAEARSADRAASEASAWRSRVARTGGDPDGEGHEAKRAALQAVQDAYDERAKVLREAAWLFAGVDGDVQAATAAAQAKADWEKKSAEDEGGDDAEAVEVSEVTAVELDLADESGALVGLVPDTKRRYALAPPPNEEGEEQGESLLAPGVVYTLHKIVTTTEGKGEPEPLTFTLPAVPSSEPPAAAS